MDFKNVNSSKDPSRVDETLDKVKEEVEKMHLDKQQPHQEEEGDEQAQLPIWMRKNAIGGEDDDDDDHGGDKILSVYPFLDVCSKLITDIV